MIPTARPSIGFVGCGQAAETHGRLLRKLSPESLLAFASRDPTRAEHLAQRLGGRAFPGYEAAIASPEVHTIAVTTPPHLHLAPTLEALAAGKDVIVEKPAFLDVTDFDRVAEAARTAGRRVFVAENYFYKPVRFELARRLADRAVGTPLLIKLNAVKHQAPEGWRTDPERAGGGALFEGGIHWVNFIANLGLKIESATGWRAGADPQGKPRGPETFVVTIRFACGAIGTIHFSWEVPSPLKGLRISAIYGTEGSLWFESNGLALVSGGARKRVSLPGLRDLSGSRAMWQDFLDALRTDREPLMTLAMARRDVRLVRDVYRSSDEAP
jgi:predicted dehydrogenase